MPKPWGKWVRRLPPAMLLFAILAVFLLLYHRPRVYDAGGAELSYRSGGSIYRFLLRNTANDDFHWKSPQPSYTRTVTTGTQAAVPLQLYVYEEESGGSAAEWFAAAASSTELAAVPQSGALDISCGEPAANAGFPRAALEADLVYTAGEGSSLITWALHMKNGDCLLLHETVEISLRPEAAYSYENTPLADTGELQALLDSLPLAVGEETAVTIILAPITYEGELRVERAVNLVGSSDGETGTVFTGPVILNASQPEIMSLKDIAFQGEEAGIRASVGFFAEDCRFAGNSTGILAEDGAWPMVYGCSFTDCKTGLCFDSASSTVKNALFQGNSFTGNGTAVQLLRIPGDDVLYFLDCVFSGNGTDIDNRTRNAVEFTR